MTLVDTYLSPKIKEDSKVVVLQSGGRAELRKDWPVRLNQKDASSAVVAGVATLETPKKIVEPKPDKKASKPKEETEVLPTKVPRVIKRGK